MIRFVLILLAMAFPLVISAQVVSRTELRNTNLLIRADTVGRLNGGSTNQELHEATVKGYLNFDAPNSFIEVENWLWQLYVGPDLRSRIDINTNNGHIGFNTYGDTNLMVASWTAYGQAPPTTNTTVTTRDTQGAVYLLGGVGRDTTATTTGTAGQAGRFQAIGGNGGSAPLAQTNSTGGTGGTAFLIGGFGGNDYLLHPSYAATNANTGGNGGPVQILGGTPGIPGNLAGTSATNTVTGNGGAVTINGGTSESPQGGWTRKTGTGGGVSITGGSTGDSTRTNSGNAGAITITGGSSGNATTSGNPGTPGSVNIVGGNGGTGDSNAFGGSITLLPGDGGGAAADGNVLLGVNLAGTARGNVGIGTNAPAKTLSVNGGVQFRNLDSSNAAPVAVAVFDASGNLTHGALGVAAAAGNSGAVQFNEGGSFAGTNTFTYDRTNSALSVSGGDGSLALTGSGSSAKIKVAPTNNVTVTNLIGLVHQSPASVLVWDANQANSFSITGRITGAVTIVISNTSDGQIIDGEIIGEIAGGTSRVVTIVPHLGHLISDEDDFSAALATSTSFTLTNGNKAEFSGKIRKLNGTNTMGKVVRQSKF